MLNLPTVLSRQTHLESVWGYDFFGDAIETGRGIGYRLDLSILTTGNA